jgi:hypothetical protein
MTGPRSAGTVLRGMVWQLALYTPACGPVLLVGAAWLAIWMRIRRRSPILLGLTALVVATANTALTAGTVLYYQAKPGPFRPPWEDPEILHLALLFLSAPVGIALAVWAGLRGAPRWLTWTIGASSLPLMFIGFLACGAV